VTEIVYVDLCEFWMRNNREKCARRKGHKGDHRSKAAMDYAYLMKVGRKRPEFVAR
jgi:hypothetical protein